MNKVMSYTFSLRQFLATLLALSLFSGCSSCFKPRLPRYCGGRPQVITSKEQYIIDYNDCFQEFQVGKDAECLQGIQKQPLTPDMFDPFAPVDENYRLARGDILEISVFGEDETTVENAMIAPDGKLYYTVLEGIPASGRTSSELAEDLSKNLENLFVNPIVLVVPKATESLKYRILGRVRDAGEYSLEGPTTLKEAIGGAGGLISESDKIISSYGYGRALTGAGGRGVTTFSNVGYGRGLNVPTVDLEKSFIVRENKKLDIDFGKLLLSEDNSQNIFLRPKDYIYIAEADKKEVFLLGYLNAPQRLPFVPGMTLMSALASVEGWPTPSPYSPDLKRFLIIRGSLECPQVCQVDLKKILTGKARDVHIMPGDIIYATHKQFRLGRELVHIAIDSFIYGFFDSAALHFTEAHWFLRSIDDDKLEGVDNVE